jgi:uncharacterized membrane protein YfcA
VETIVLFYILLFLVAFLYSSVGHGGASGYLALMAIFSVTPDVMKPTALLLNLFVSLTSFIQFYRGKHFNWKIFLPFAITSVPMAYVGGLISVDDNIYKKILGILLIIPIARFLFFANIKVEEIRRSDRKRRSISLEHGRGRHSVAMIPCSYPFNRRYGCFSVIQTNNVNSWCGVVDLPWRYAWSPSAPGRRRS